jgi:hypothetical protein
MAKKKKQNIFQIVRAARQKYDGACIFVAAEANDGYFVEGPDADLVGTVVKREPVVEMRAGKEVSRLLFIPRETLYAPTGMVMGFQQVVQELSKQRHRVIKIDYTES